MHTFSFAFLILLHAPTISGQTENSIPAEFEGVWKITKAIAQDGTERPVTSDLDHSVANEIGIELIVVANRVVFVKPNGDSVWCKAKVLSSDSDLKIELVTGICHDKDQTPTVGLLRLAGGELSFSCLPSDIESLDDSFPVTIIAVRDDAG